jgi:hypothetical protein
VDTGWSSDKKEKSMNAGEVAAILRGFALSPIIKADS